MLTVMELLSFPLFRGFRLVSGYGGLYNLVTGTGIFEWESSSEVEKNFEQGEFVMTTLSLARSDSALAEDSIRLLIDKKVSAVAVKEVYYHDISEELKTYSDAHNIPVLFFSDTFFDDIIYTIKNTLLTQRHDFSLEEQVNSLLDASLPPEKKKRKAKEINPFFHSNIICCYCTPKKTNWKKELKAPALDPKETVFSMIGFRQGILLIYTTTAPVLELESKLNTFLEKTGFNKIMNSIGLSSSVQGLENLGLAIQESLYAHSSSSRNQLKSVSFSNTGMDRIILPMADSFWTKRYYESQLKKLTGYDELHGSKLLETLLVYIECDGDIKLTAQMLYQHGNTIRYRIDKIRKLLMLEANAASFAQLYTFTLLHRIYQEEE